MDTIIFDSGYMAGHADGYDAIHDGDASEIGTAYAESVPVAYMAGVRAGINAALAELRREARDARKTAAALADAHQ